MADTACDLPGYFSSLSPYFNLRVMYLYVYVFIVVRNTFYFLISAVKIRINIVYYFSICVQTWLLYFNPYIAFSI